jgi:hypothetical protein
MIKYIVVISRNTKCFASLKVLNFPVGTHQQIFLWSLTSAVLLVQICCCLHHVEVFACVHSAYLQEAPLQSQVRTRRPHSVSVDNDADENRFTFPSARWMRRYIPFSNSRSRLAFLELSNSRTARNAKGPQGAAGRRMRGM